MPQYFESAFPFRRICNPTVSNITLKCQKVEHGYLPVSVYADLSDFKLYMGDIGLLALDENNPKSAKSPPPAEDLADLFWPSSL